MNNKEYIIIGLILFVIIISKKDKFLFFFNTTALVLLCVGFFTENDIYVIISFPLLVCIGINIIIKLGSLRKDR
jgi:hypothetical protein